MHADVVLISIILNLSELLASQTSRVAEPCVECKRSVSRRSIPARFVRRIPVNDLRASEQALPSVAGDAECRGEPAYVTLCFSYAIHEHLYSFLMKLSTIKGLPPIVTFLYPWIVQNALYLRFRGNWIHRRGCRIFYPPRYSWYKGNSTCTQ